MTIKIKLDNRGNIRKVRTNGDITIAAAAVKRAADKPNRYKIKRTYRSRFLGGLKKLISRIGFVTIQTAKAFATACKKANAQEDIPRHQNGEAVV